MTFIATTLISLGHLKMTVRVRACACQKKNYIIKAAKKKKVCDGFTKLERVFYEREWERRAAEQSTTCIQPNEKLSKGQNTAASFKGHALMVTLPQTLSNRPRRSLGSTRVVGDTRQTRPRYVEAFIRGSSTWLRSEGRFGVRHSLSTFLLFTNRNNSKRHQMTGVSQISENIETNR